MAKHQKRAEAHFETMGIRKAMKEVPAKVFYFK
jgi:hypothetical protein